MQLIRKYEWPVKAVMVAIYFAVMSAALHRFI